MVFIKTLDIPHLWNQEGHHWRVFDAHHDLIDNYEDEMEAFNMANELAESNRPSKEIHSKDCEEK